MGKVVAQIVKGDIVDKVPLGLRGTRFEGPKPVMDAGFSQAFITLRNEDVGARNVTTAVEEVVVEWAARFVVEVNIADLAAFVADVQPAGFAREMGVLQPQPCDVTDTTPGPVAEREERGAARSTVTFNQAA